MASEGGIAVVIPSARDFPAELVDELLRQGADEVVVVQNRPARAGRHWAGVPRHRRARPPAVAGHERAASPRLAVIFDAEGGAASARNVGWRLATSGTVLFLDDDVHVGSGFVDAVRRLRAQERADVIGLRVVGHHTPAPFSRTIRLDRGEDDRGPARAVPLADAWMYGTGAALLVARSVLTACGGFKSDLGAGRRHGGAEDLEFVWHASRHGTVAYRAEPSVTHDNPTSRRDALRKLRDYARAIGHLGAAVPAEGRPMLRGFASFVRVNASPELPPSGRAVALGRIVAEAVRAYALHRWLDRPRVLCDTCAPRQSSSV